MELTEQELAAIKRHAFWDGVREGQQRNMEMLKSCATTMRHGADLIGLIDFHYPIEGVMISSAFTERLIQHLKVSRCTKMARDLQILLDETNLRAAAERQKAADEIAGMEE